MPSYSLTAVNVGSYPLGESDKVLTLFSAERGLTKAVAKGARKPGTKIAGRADVLRVNKILVASGRSLDIITQAETLESFGPLRNDLTRLSYALYYAELTSQFGQGLVEESQAFFTFLCDSLRLQARGAHDAAMLCLRFEMHLLELLGLKPEIDFCVICRCTITESTIAAFDHELGGIVCTNCFGQARAMPRNRVSEGAETYAETYMDSEDFVRVSAFKTHVTPLVWKILVLASHSLPDANADRGVISNHVTAANAATRRLVQTYIEHKAGRKMKALSLLSAPS
jgi:DNA repair protein RecO (recombination protein O)